MYSSINTNPRRTTHSTVSTCLFWAILGTSRDPLVLLANSQQAQLAMSLSLVLFLCALSHYRVGQLTQQPIQGIGTHAHWSGRGLAKRRFPEITGEDNLTVFSYSGRVKSPEWRWQRRRADLRHFEIFRHGPTMIYTSLPAGRTYYPICMFPASSECLIGISDAFSDFCLRVSVIFPTCSLYPQQKRAYSALHPQAWTCIYI